MDTELTARQLPQDEENSSGGAGFPTSYLCFGPFELDPHRQRLTRNKSGVKILSKVYQALIALLENPGKIVTREALRMYLWPTGIPVNYDANLNATVNKLRRILGDWGLA